MKPDYVYVALKTSGTHSLQVELYETEQRAIHGSGRQLISLYGSKYKVEEGLGCLVVKSTNPEADYIYEILKRKVQ